MTNTQQLGDIHMAIQINKQLYEQGKITDEMYRDANRIFTERLYHIKNDTEVGAQNAG